MRRRLSFAAAAIAVCLILITSSPISDSPVISAFPQAKPKPDERKRPNKPELESGSPQEERPQEGRQKGYTIGVHVDLVVVHTSVYDKNGHFVGGLKKENFKLFEDGVAQNVSFFSQEDVPVSMGITLDISGSMRNKIEMVNRSALAFIKASNPEDEVFLVGFNDEIELLEDYTSDIDLITDALENTIVSGGTALYDAIYLSIQKAQTGKKPKKAVVVVSDGEDRDSYYKLDELVAKVQELDVQVYTIGIMNPIPEKGLFGRFSKSVPEKARDALQKISDETGGKAFFPQKVAEMNGIVSEIAHELRNQYSIGFISSNPARDGAFRRVKIVLEGSDPSHHLRYRKGYFAAKPQS
jgi:Ca-activated chloride channel homolog